MRSCQCSDMENCASLVNSQCAGVKRVKVCCCCAAAVIETNWFSLMPKMRNSCCVDT